MMRRVNPDFGTRVSASANGRLELRKIADKRTPWIVFDPVERQRIYFSGTKSKAESMLARLAREERYLTDAERTYAENLRARATRMQEGAREHARQVAAGEVVRGPVIAGVQMWYPAKQNPEIASSLLPVGAFVWDRFRKWSTQIVRARRVKDPEDGVVYAEYTLATPANKQLLLGPTYTADAVHLSVVPEKALRQPAHRRAAAAARVNPTPHVSLRVPSRVVRSPAAHGYASIGKQLGATLVRDLAYWSAGAGATAKLWPVLKAAGQPHRLPTGEVPMGDFRAVEIVYENFVRPHLHPSAEGFVRGQLQHYFNLGN